MGTKEVVGFVQCFQTFTNLLSYLANMDTNEVQLAHVGCESKKEIIPEEKKTVSDMIRDELFE